MRIIFGALPKRATLAALPLLLSACLFSVAPVLDETNSTSGEESAELRAFEEAFRLAYDDNSHAPVFPIFPGETSNGDLSMIRVAQLDSGMLLIQEKLRGCISDHCFAYYVARMREKWSPDICFVETEEEEAIDTLLAVAGDYGVTVSVIADNEWHETFNRSIMTPPGFGMDGPRKSQMDFLRAQFAEGQLSCMSKRVGSPLHVATAEAKPASVYALIEAGADVDVRNEEGETPLYIAAEEGNSEIIAALIEAGADVNVPDEGGWTPLHVAAREGPPTSVSALIRAGADVNARTRDGTAGAIPLHFAANPEIIAALIKAGAEVNARITGEVFAGATPLHIAAQRGTPADVEALLDAGADGSLANDDGKTPFDLIKENQYFSFDGTGAYTRLEEARHK